MEGTARKGIRPSSARVLSGADGDGMYTVCAGRKGRKYRVLPPEAPGPEEIRGIREKKGMTREQFAGALGISVSTVVSWENGRKTPAGAACRLLDLIGRDAGLIDRYIRKDGKDHD